MRKNPKIPTTLLRGKVNTNNGINITWKTGDPAVSCFAPYKEDSQGYLKGNITWDEYATRYLAKLNAIPKAAFKEAAQYIFNAGIEVTLLCYCNPRTLHCHLELLIHALVFRYPKAFRQVQVALED